MSAVALPFIRTFEKIRNHASEFTDLIILILIYFEKGIGIYAVFLKILIIGMDFRARKVLYGHSAHHFFFSSSTIHVSLPRLITDYEMQKYLSFQLPVIRYRERFWQYME